MEFSVIVPVLSTHNTLTLARVSILSSLKKKFKKKDFAAGCSREDIAAGAEMLGVPLETLMQDTLDAMKSLAGTLPV